MKYAQDFVDGFVSDNILRGLQLCSRSTITELKKKKLLLPNAKFPTITCASLTYKGIEEYADITGLSLSYFFFGQHEPPTPTYTPIDGKVISLLNTFNEQQLDAALTAVELFFSNNIAAYKETDPNKRFIRCLTRLPRATRLCHPILPHQVIENDIHSVLQYRYSLSKGKNIRWFPTDLFPDLATYVRVSLHWIFGFEKHPLFCKNVKADKLFSYFTLLPEAQYNQFFIMLAYIEAGDLSGIHDCLGDDIIGTP